MVISKSLATHLDYLEAMVRQAEAEIAKLPGAGPVAIDVTEEVADGELHRLIYCQDIKRLSVRSGEPVRGESERPLTDLPVALKVRVAARVVEFIAMARDGEDDLAEEARRVGNDINEAIEGLYD